MIRKDYEDLELFNLLLQCATPTIGADYYCNHYPRRFFAHSGFATPPSIFYPIFSNIEYSIWCCFRDLAANLSTEHRLFHLYSSSLLALFAAGKLNQMTTEMIDCYHLR